MHNLKMTDESRVLGIDPITLMKNTVTNEEPLQPNARMRQRCLSILCDTYNVGLLVTG